MADEYQSKRIIPTKPRTCLKCNETFQSTGPGNRVCPKCNNKNEKIVSKNVSKVVTDKNRGKD